MGGPSAGDSDVLSGTEQEVTIEAENGEGQVAGLGTDPTPLPVEVVPVTHLFDLKGGLSHPTDIAVSADGRAYVVDGVNHRVVVFDREGDRLSSFGQAGRGALLSPLGIALGSSGRVYVADSGNHRVVIFDSEGTYLDQIQVPAPPGRSRAADPTDVVVDEAADRCFVVDNDNHRIVRFELSTKTLVGDFGSYGTRQGYLHYPFLAALDAQGRLYVVEVINARVQVFDPEERHLGYVGAWGVEQGEFHRPKGVALDRDGRVFVSDSFLGVIQVFSPRGDFQGVVGDPGTDSPRIFQTPMGIFVDWENRVFVVERSLDRVGVYQLAR
jgi:DNA-binding beta-propeller fold protein YncE